MELITKENLRLSGIYGKKILDSINASLIKEDEGSLHYKQNKTHFFCYRTNNKIYIFGDNSEDLYSNIIRNIEFYLLRLAKVDDEILGLRLCADLYNEQSLYSNYHIFSMEVLRGLVLRNPERANYAEFFATSVSWNSLPIYEELMYFILYCEDDELVFHICEKLKETIGSKYQATWKKLSSGIDPRSQETIYENLRKIKI